jgi:polyferredoxin
MNRLFRFWWFPLVLQVMTLVVFVLLIVDGFAADTDNMALARILRNTNLANLIVWSYWWPVIIISAIFFGRIWCMVCPMELLTSLAARIGLKQRPNRFVRSGWIITLFYILILFVGIHTLSIHRVPFRMSIYLLALLAFTVIVGLIFSRNTFCAYICPVGHLLGLYARLAPFGWSTGDRSICRNCKDHSCTARVNAYVFQGRSCGVGLNPAHIDDNTDCLLCGQCVKSCDYNNPGIEGRPNPGWFVRPWFKDIFALKPMTTAQTAFCLIVSGFVVYEVFTEWNVTKGLLLWLPDNINMWLGIGNTWSHGLIKSLILFVFLPTLAWLLPYGLFRLAGGKLPIKEFFCIFGIAFIPIMAAAHTVKALLKTTSRIPYWGNAFTDPVGVESARGILDKSLQLASLPAWRDPAVTVLSLIFICCGITVSTVVIRKLTMTYVRDSGRRAWTLYLIPSLYGGAFAVMICLWRLF